MYAFTCKHLPPTFLPSIQLSSVTTTDADTSSPNTISLPPLPSCHHPCLLEKKMVCFPFSSAPGASSVTIQALGHTGQRLGDDHGCSSWVPTDTSTGAKAPARHHVKNLDLHPFQQLSRVPGKRLSQPCRMMLGTKTERFYTPSRCFLLLCPPAQDRCLLKYILCFNFLSLPPAAEKSMNVL